MVVRVEDLVRWSCAQSSGWSGDLKPTPCGTNGLHKPLQTSDENCGDADNKSGEPLNVKAESKTTFSDALASAAVHFRATESIR